MAPKKMLAKKAARGGSQRKQVVKVKTTVAPPRSKVLDRPAAEYAGLLVDPCNAKVVPPIYPGSDAGFLFRAESFVSYGTSAGETAGVVHWTPGYVNSSQTELLSSVSAAGSTATTIIANSASPGRAFLAANAKACRCVAACVRVTFPGAESARSGRVHFGITQAGMLADGTSVSPDNVAQTLTNYTRTPAEAIELVWRPNISDTEFNDPTDPQSVQVRDRKAALTVAWAGLPAAVGLTFHFTAVYEWTPAIGLGVGHNPQGKAVSRNSLDDVLDVIKSKGFNFVKGVGATLAQGALASMTGGISSTYGIMPAVMATRRLAF